MSSGPAVGTMHAPNPETAADVMITRPKVLPADATVRDVRALFDDDHVAMVLLCEGDRLLGALVRQNLPDTVPSAAPALPARRETRTFPRGRHSGQWVSARLPDDAGTGGGPGPLTDQGLHRWGE